AVCIMLLRNPPQRFPTFHDVLEIRSVSGHDLCPKNHRDNHKIAHRTVLGGRMENLDVGHHMFKRSTGNISCSLELAVPADAVAGHKMAHYFIVALTDSIVITGFKCPASNSGDLHGITDNVVGLWLLNSDAHDDSSHSAPKRDSHRNRN